MHGQGSFEFGGAFAGGAAAARQRRFFIEVVCVTKVTLVKTIAAFRDLSQAHLAKGKLEAEGVFSILLDEYLVGIDWVYSQAIGGVKLQVRDSDVKGSQYS